MRVVAGQFKSRQLKAPKGESTRPTTDKNKESLFNQIGPYFEGGTSLDLFGGSGGLSIEAISRGISHGTIVEKDFRSMKIIKENVEMLKINNQVTLYQNDAFKVLSQLHQSNKLFDLIFIDPPYNQNLANLSIHLIDEYQLLNKRGLVIVETLKEEIIDPLNHLNLIKEKINGITMIRIYSTNE